MHFFNVLGEKAYLVAELTKRDIQLRYRGSAIGLGWALFTPIFMLAIYSFVFLFIFQAKWDLPDQAVSPNFVLILFVGLIVHGLFAEVLSRSPTLILSNISYVKKVVFPLELLVIPVVGSAVFHALIGVAILLVASLVLDGTIVWTFPLVSIVLLPLVILTLGIGWFFAALGVYLRDLSQFVGLLVTVALFLSPTFYPLSIVPESVRWAMYLNPITYPIEQARQVLVLQAFPDFFGLALYAVVALMIAQLGYLFFQKTRHGFADVL